MMDVAAGIMMTYLIFYILILIIGSWNCDQVYGLKLHKTEKMGRDPDIHSMKH